MSFFVILYKHKYAVYSTLKKHSDFCTPVLQLTLTFEVIAASTVIIDLLSRTSICTEQRLYCGADSWFLDHCAIDAGSSCAVFHFPCLAILHVVKNTRHTKVFQHIGLYSSPFRCVVVGKSKSNWPKKRYECCTYYFKIRTKSCQIHLSGFFLPNAAKWS